MRWDSRPFEAAWDGPETPPEPDHTCPLCGGAVSASGHCMGCDWPAWEES